MTNTWIDHHFLNTKNTSFFSTKNGLKTQFWQMLFQFQPIHRIIDLFGESPVQTRAVNPPNDSLYFAIEIKKRVQIFIGKKDYIFFVEKR